MNNSSSLGLRMHTKRQSLVKSIGTNNLTINQSTKISWSVFAVTWALGHFNDDRFKAPPPPNKSLTTILQCLSQERLLEKPILQNFYPTGSLVRIY